MDDDKRSGAQTRTFPTTAIDRFCSLEDWYVNSIQMGYSLSCVRVSNEQTLQNIPVNTIAFFICVGEIAFSFIAFVYFLFNNKFLAALAVVLFVCSVLFLVGHQKRRPNLYIPLILFLIPSVIVFLLITGYNEFIVIFFTDEKLKEKFMHVLKSAGIGFFGILQLYYVYILHSAYQWLKDDIVRKQRMERIEAVDEMRVYP